MEVEFRFVQACISGDLYQVKQLIKEHPDLDVHFGFYSEEEGFRNACVYGHLDVVKWLVEYAISIGSPINIRSALYGRTFESTLANGHYKLLKWVVKRHREASPDHPDMLINPRTSFRSACEVGNLKGTKWLVSYMKYVDFCGIFCRLHYLPDAAKGGNVELVKWLIGSTKSAEPIRPLLSISRKSFLTACHYGHIEIAKWLVTAIENFNMISEEAFLIACRHGHIKLAKWLFNYGESIGSPVNIYYDGPFGEISVPFARACRNKHLEVAKWLIHFGGMPVEHLGKNHPIRRFYLGRFSIFALISIYFRRYVLSFRERYYCPGGKGYEKSKKEFEKYMLLC